MDIVVVITIVGVVIGIIAGVFQVIQYFQERKEKNNRLILEKQESKPIVKAIHHNLPPRREFVGRQIEKTLVHELLCSVSKLVEIDGMGGIGKTSLAVEVAQECLTAQKENLPSDKIAKFDGIVWISAKDQELFFKKFLDTIARTLEQPGIIAQNVDDEVVDVRKLLQKKPYLLVVDNLETINDERILSFLRDLPDPSKALITTRQKKISQMRSVSLTGLSEAESLSLIRQEGQRLGLQKLTHADDQILFRVYQLTGGTPLAIKWAIGQIKQKGQSLDSVLRSLQMARGDIFEDIFIISWNLLSGDARQVLKVLGLFVAPASRPAVEAASDIHNFALDDAIGQLVEMSLAEVTNELNAFNQRLSIHPLTRAFVIGKLENDDTEIEKDAQERAADYYLDLVTSYFPLSKDLQDTDEHKGIARLLKYRAFVEKSNSLIQRPNYSELEIDLENILSSVDWCYRNQKNEMLIDFSLSLTGFFEHQGHSEESIKHGENAIKAARAQHDTAAVALLNRFPVGWFYYVVGNYEEAKQKSKESIQIFEELGDLLYLAATKRLLGLALLRQKDLTGATLALEEGKNFAERYSVENEQVAYSLIHLGDVALANGEREKAKNLFSEAYEMFQRVAYEPGMASALDQLADIERDFGQLELALMHYDELRRLSDLLGKERGVGHYHLGQGLIMELQSEYEEAEREIETALAIYKRLGAKPRITETEEALQRINHVISSEKIGGKVIRRTMLRIRKLRAKR